MPIDCFLVQKVFVKVALCMIFISLANNFFELLVQLFLF